MTPAPFRTQRGLSLIEVLVGVAVGMIGILVVFQTMAVWTKHNQTTGSGSEAQITGTLAMYNVERDIKQAGYGYARAASTVMGCGVMAKGNSMSFPLAPVRIASSPAAPDAIDVLYGNSPHFVTQEEFTESTPTSKKLKRRGGFRAGDLIVVASNDAASAASASCILVEVTNASLADGVTIEHRTGAYDSFYRGPGASAVFNSSASAPAFATGGTIYNLGPRPQYNRWNVASGVLQRTELIHGGAAFSIGENVADFKAQYGVDLNGDQQIGVAEWSANPPADWSRVLAVRVAVLIRGQQFEKDADAASGVPRWTGGAFVMRNVDGATDSYSATDVDPNNWRYYRYRVYERTIPLRNMVWGTM